MKTIQLTKNKQAFVDDNELERLSKYRWTFDGRYASFQDWKSKKKTLMHRFIMKTPKGMETDHINGNKLDNRKENLRICTQSQNKANVGLIHTNKSGYKGVSFVKEKKKYKASIMFNKKTIHLGYFSDPIEAAKTYDLKAKELFGEFARVNFE